MLKNRNGRKLFIKENIYLVWNNLRNIWYRLWASFVWTGFTTSKMQKRSETLLFVLSNFHDNIGYEWIHRSCCIFYSFHECTSCLVSYSDKVLCRFSLFSRSTRFKSNCQTETVPQPVITYSKLTIKNTRTRCEICSKLTIETPERRLTSFEHISQLVLVFLLLTFNKSTKIFYLLLK